MPSQAVFKTEPGVSHELEQQTPVSPPRFVLGNESVPSTTWIVGYKAVSERVALKPLRGLRRRPLYSASERRHLEFLRRVSTLAGDGPGLVSVGTADQARRVWEAVRRATSIRVPAASVGEGGTILYAWDVGNHHLEVEIREGVPVEWMYVQRQTGETWFASQDELDSVSPDLLARLKSLG